MTFISVVVPLNNEELIVDELVNRLLQTLELIEKSYEIIIVDDGSTDLTWQKLEEVSRKDNRIKCLKLSRNFGQHSAITAGLEFAQGNWNVVMDGDLQDRPEVIPALLDEALKGFDVVFVSRQNRPETKKYLAMQRIFYNILNKLSGLQIDSAQANFSIINSTVREAYLKIPEQIRFYGSAISWLGFKRSKIGANHGGRYKGKTSYSLKSRIKLAVDIIFSYSNRPLIFGTLLGFILTLLSLGMLAAILIRYLLFGFTVMGWASLMVSIFFSTGAILFMIGVMGLYIGRIFEEVKRRPIYIIDKKINT